MRNLQKLHLARLLMSLVASVLILSAVSVAYAQDPRTGAITGVVYDPSGAVVAGATIRVIRASTGEEVRTTQTGGDGTYRVGLLNPGDYIVEVSAPNFSPIRFEKVNVRVTEVTTLNATLRAGTVTAEVTVTEEAGAAVNTTNPTMGATIQVVEELPLSTRNYLNLLSLPTGASSSLPESGALGRGEVNIFVNGQRSTANNVEIEGVNTTDFNLGQLDFVPIPNPDTIQEFRTQTSLYDATHGFKTGGQVNAVLKSGGDSWNGTLWEFFRNEVLNANEFFLNRAGQPRPVLKQNQFGFTAGGPLSFLGFGFFSYQGTRQRSGIAPGTNINVNLPLGIPADRSRESLFNTFFAGTPAAAAVTAADLDQVAINILNFQSNQFGGPFLIPSITSNPFSLSRPGRFTEDQWMANLDRQFGANDKFAGRYFSSDTQLFKPFGATSGLAFPQANPTKNRLAILTETHTFSPTVVNEFRFGFNRFVFLRQGIELVQLADVGATRPNAADFPGLYQLIFSSTGFAVGPGVNEDRGTFQNSFTWGDTLSWTTGGHTLRFGGEAVRYQLNRFNNFARRGSVSFRDTTIPGTDVRITDFQAFLLGIPRATQANAGIGQFYFRNTDWSLFIQDDWKVRPSFTLNLGLRYDVIGTSHEKFNRLTNLIDLDPGVILANRQVAFIHPEDLNIGNIRGTPGVSRCTLYHCRDVNNFGPRFGFAWDIGGNARTVLRGGYGIYYLRVTNQSLLQSTGGPPFDLATSETSPGVRALERGLVFRNLLPQSAFPLAQDRGIPAVVDLDPATGAPIFTDAPIGFVFFMDRNFRAPYTQQWNLTLQHEIGAGWMGEIGYVGTKGTGLILSGLSINAARLATPANPITIQTLNGPRTITESLFTNLDARVPIPGILNNRLLPQTNAGSSIYHSLQTSLLKRLAHGFYFLAAYTFSRSIDNESGALSVSELGSGPFGNQFDTRQSRGLSDYDRTHRLTVSFNYELPFARFADTGAGRALLGGWELNSVIIAQSGLPFSIIDAGAGSIFGTDVSNFASASIPPAFTLANVRFSGRTQGRINQFFNTGAFTNAPFVNRFGQVVPEDGLDAQGQIYGNLGRNILRGPRQWNVDFSLVKKTRIAENHEIEFRSEFFNIFNRPNFALPDSEVTSPTFGRIFNTVGAPRIIQFALRYSFGGLGRGRPAPAVAPTPAPAAAPPANQPPTASCTADRTSVRPGESATITATASDPDNDTIRYNWRTTAGQLRGEGSSVTLDTTDMTPGSSATVMVTVDDGRGGTADCSVTIALAAPEPPSVSCTVDKTAVRSGESVTVSVQGASPSGEMISYNWTVTGGRITGDATATSVTIDTTGLSAGSYTATVTAVARSGAMANCSAVFTVELPPPPPMARTLSTCTFARRNVVRVDNACKALVDDAAQQLQREPRATLVVRGHAEQRERAGTARRRAENVRQDLMSRHNIDGSRIVVQEVVDGTMGVEIILVPEGAEVPRQ